MTTRIPHHAKKERNGQRTRNWRKVWSVFIHLVVCVRVCLLFML